MADTGWVSAGLGESIVWGSGTIHWTTPTNIYLSDNNYAYKSHGENDITHYLRATTFGFSIPVGSTINGIETRFEKKAAVALTIEDYSVKIVKAGSEQGTDKASAVVWTTTDTYYTYGGVSELWGLSWSVADINASNFGVSISAVNYEESSVTAYVDHVQIKVYYTPPSTNIKINIGDSWKDVDEVKINIGGSWKTVTKVQINIGDVWKDVFG